MPPLFKKGIITMLQNTRWFKPPIFVAISAINISAGALGGFYDRTTVATVAFTSLADARRFNTSLNNPMLLVVNYGEYTFYPTPSGGPVTMTVPPDGQTQLTVTMILCSFGLVILLALYFRYRRGDFRGPSYDESSPTKKNTDSVSFMTSDR